MHLGSHMWVEAKCVSWLVKIKGPSLNFLILYTWVTITILTGLNVNSNAICITFAVKCTGAVPGDIAGINNDSSQETGTGTWTGIRSFLNLARNPLLPELISLPLTIAFIFDTPIKVHCAMDHIFLLDMGYYKILSCVVQDDAFELRIHPEVHPEGMLIIYEHIK